MGVAPIFCLCIAMRDLAALLEPTLEALGYELVDCLWASRGKLQVTIDKPAGVRLDDCALVSNQLSRFLTVEGVDYDRLEVSSPGLDRVLKKPQHFERFRGERAHIKLRIPVAGQRNFTGVLGALEAGVVRLQTLDKDVAIELANIDKARLVPNV